MELLAVSRPSIRPLMYDRWVADNASRVAELSKGKLGYIHIPSMDEEGLEHFVRSLYSDNFDKEAIVLDVRYNGGGNTHDKVLNYLGGKEHTLFYQRHGGIGRGADLDRPQVQQTSGAPHQQPQLQRRGDPAPRLSHAGPGQAGGPADRRPGDRHFQVTD